MSAPILSPNGVAIWVDVPRECRCKRMANLFINRRGVTGCSQCINEKEEAK